MALETTPVADALVSDLAGDEEIADLVRDFVRALPGRAEAITQAAEARDWDALRRAAHQLKGSAGSYGFPPITDAARAVEGLASEAAPPGALDESIQSLATLCRRARAS
jgi:HPt (histidine-containing phosphotransfer) domain-containing protein